MLFTIMFLALLLLSYGALGLTIFAANDPYHFGTYAIAFVTLFPSATFENWSVVWYLNYGGCDSFPSEYTGSAGPVRVETVFGNFILPYCSQPDAQPLISAFFFVSFSFFAGFVSVSMSLAAVALGVSERLNELRNVELFGEDRDAKKVEVNASVKSLMKGKSGKSGKEKGSDKNIDKVMKMMGAEANKERRRGLERMLQEVWSRRSISRRPSVLQDVGNALIRGSKSWRELIRHLRERLNAESYEKLVVGVLIADGVTQLVDLTAGTTMVIIVLRYIFTAFFTVNFLFQGMLRRRHERFSYIADGWVQFDGLTIAALWVPTIAYNLTYLRFIHSLRILRWLLVAKYLSFIPDLNIIMDALASSFASTIYVVFILLLIFYYFAIAGVLLFEVADPYHFGSIPQSYRTLVQVMTFDNWSDIMRTCMYGCVNHAYNTGLPKFDSLCQSNGDGRGVGWWAPIYFLTFAVISGFVLTSLLTAVIITSLQLLREEYNDTDDIQRKLQLIKRMYKLNDGMVESMLDIFERLDSNQNSYLAFKELTEIFSIFELPEELQFEVYMKVDRDGSGQIDFAEFCEMLSLLKLAQENDKVSEAGGSYHSKRQRKSVAASNLAVTSLLADVPTKLSGSILRMESRSRGGTGRSIAAAPPRASKMSVPHNVAWNSQTCFALHAKDEEGAITVQPIDEPQLGEVLGLLGEGRDARYRVEEEEVHYGQISTRRVHSAERSSRVKSNKVLPV